MIERTGKLPIENTTEINMEPVHSTIKISLVIPSYNEGKNITHLYMAIKPIMERLQLSYEVIFVDDGSTDDTFSLLEQLHLKDATVKVIKLRRNFGQTPAMAAGIDHARGEVIVTLDADLQNDPQDIPRLLDKLNEGYDIVSGWRKERRDKAISRKLPSMIANGLIGFMTGVKIHDYGCTLKAYRAEVIKQMHLYSDMHRFLPALGALSGAKVAELVVTHHPRLHGKSKYGISRTFKVLIDVLTVKLITRFSSRPFHMFAALGTIAVLIGLFLGFKSLQLYFSHPEETLTPIVFPTVSLMFIFLGIYLFGLGILSELILKLSKFRISRLKVS